MSTLAAARAGDQHAFAELVNPHRHELRVHCYRMLGSADDAEDAFQETLLAAWKGLPGFEERSSLRTWLYRIATRCCLRLARGRPARVLSWDRGPAFGPDDDLGTFVDRDTWVEPWPDSLRDPGPAELHERREDIGLAWTAALQALPPNQRAVLILREVLAFSAAEVGALLDTSVPSVNSALQRARRTLADRPAAQPADPSPEDRQAAEAFVAAFTAGDVDRLVGLLADDVRFTMPPLAAWFDGRADVSRFLRERVLATRWRARLVEVNGQPAMACYREVDGDFLLSALNVLTVAGGRVEWIASFLDPALLARLELPGVW